MIHILFYLKFVNGLDYVRVGLVTLSQLNLFTNVKQKFKHF